MIGNSYTASLKRDSDWWIGWCEEVPGTNCQEATRNELLESLRIVLWEALEFDGMETLGKYPMADVEVTIRLPVELVNDAEEFGVIDDRVISALLRLETDRRIMEFVNSEIKAYRAEKAGNRNEAKKK